MTFTSEYIVEVVGKLRLNERKSWVALKKKLKKLTSIGLLLKYEEKDWITKLICVCMWSRTTYLSRYHISTGLYMYY